MHPVYKEGLATPRVGIALCSIALRMNSGPMILRFNSVVRARPMAARWPPLKELG